MKFIRRFEDVQLDEGAVRMQELSTAEFQKMVAIEDPNEQVISLIFMSLETKPDAADEIYNWPVSVTNVLSEVAMRLNGLSGN